MPPLNGIDRGINGEMLKALEEIGHGARIAIVDASYDIPDGSHIVDYQGIATSTALSGILALVPTDEKTLIAMTPDEYGTPCEALSKIMSVGKEFEMNVVATRRHGIEDEEDTFARLGFYAIANDLEKHTLFIRTRDTKAYACAMFVVGHAQIT